jgi:hypothetical protein
MPEIHYSQVIEEDPQQLKELERFHRYTHLFQRVRMQRLLKTEECTNLGEAVRTLGYSWRQCQRWFASYKNGGQRQTLPIGSAARSTPPSDTAWRLRAAAEAALVEAAG